MQATLETFKCNQADKWGCSTCQVRHRYLEYQGIPKVKCDLRGFRDLETHCKCWMGKNPVEGWPDLPVGFVPKKYRSK